MKDHYQLTDEEFESQFESCTLDPNLFTHEAHIRLAWIHIRNYGVEQAVVKICDQIQHFDRIFGGGSKFHKTLTVAAVRAVFHFYQKSNSSNFKDFISEFPRLKYNLKELLETHYGMDIFNSTEAKQSYLEPDLQAFS